MRVLLGVFFNCLSGSTIRVALTQDRINGATLNLVVGGLDGLLGIILRLIGVIGQVIAFGLEFLDHRMQLGSGRRDIG